MSTTIVPEKNGPESFNEIEVWPSLGRGCRICNEPATHRMQNTVRPINGSNSKRGLPTKIADHSQDYCEKHAAALFHKIRQAMR